MLWISSYYSLYKIQRSVVFNAWCLIELCFDFIQKKIKKIWKSNTSIFSIFKNLTKKQYKSYNIYYYSQSCADFFDVSDFCEKFNGNCLFLEPAMPIDSINIFISTKFQSLYLEVEDLNQCIYK